jgi:signal transduction histidine kinase
MYRLIETMDKVSREENYAIRAEKQGEDELGDLTDGFNRMLAAVQARDENLRNAHREAELANRVKSEFLANMSHELRTPLNAIIGFSEILATEMMGPIGTAVYRDYANDIHNSGKHLLEIINDILEISRVEAGKLSLREANLDVAEVVGRTVRLVRDRAAVAKLQLAVDVAQGLPPLYADERLLKQSLLNLLTNAVKFSRAGGAIVVAVERDKEGGMVFAVRDSGIGIEAHNLDKVFRPFYQVDSSLARTQEGLGLGLPLVKSFVELHGGRVSIESEFGRGTIARLHFPAHRCRSGEASSLVAVEIERR